MFPLLQGRAWSIQFEDATKLDNFIGNLLTLRLKTMSKSWTFFIQNKGQSEVILNQNMTIQIKVENNSEMLDIQMNSKDVPWHHCLVGLKDDSKMVLVSTNFENVKDIIKNEDFNPETGISIQLKGIKISNHTAEPKKDVEKYISKVGKAVMPISKPEETKDLSAIENQPNGKG